jgi:trafficking protein particle complex subunit 3
LILKENPLSDFVVLPPQYQQSASPLWYSNLICGVVRGALDMVNMKVVCYFVKDQLNGDA